MPIQNVRNVLELPEWVVRGLAYNNYNPTGMQFDISATGLIAGPLQKELQRNHRDEIVEEASERLWSVYGTAIHAIFEEANKSFSDVVIEKRYAADYSANKKYYTVSGQIDLFEIKTRILWDIKNVSVWAVVAQDFSKFEKQLNINASLMTQNGMDVKELKVLAICRDWQRSKAGDGKYPKHPIFEIPVKLWTEEKQKTYIKERLEEHFSDEKKICSDEERWYSGDSYAILGEGRKRALKVCPTREEAEEYIEGLLFDGRVSIEHRPGVYRRCDSYCNVSDFCYLHNGE